MNADVPLVKYEDVEPLLTRAPLVPPSVKILNAISQNCNKFDNLYITNIMKECVIIVSIIFSLYWFCVCCVFVSLFLLTMSDCTYLYLYKEPLFSFHRKSPTLSKPKLQTIAICPH